MDAMTPDLMWLWLPLALAGSLISAQNVELNRRFKQEGFRLNLWRTLFAALVWFPMALIQGTWPQDGMFYVAAVFSGVGMLIGFTIQSDLAARHNGRVAILHMPMKAVLVFVIWAIIDPVARGHVFEKPMVTVGVLACLAAMVGALASFRRHDVSWTAFKAVIPIVILYSMGDILARFNLPSALLQERLVPFLAVMTATSAAVSTLLLPWRPKPELPLVSRQLVRAGLWIASGNIVNQICFFIALSIGPNPAYVSMVGLLAPVWLLVYHRLVNLKDDASPVAGTVMVVAAIVLMLLVA